MREQEKPLLTEVLEKLVEHREGTIPVLGTEEALVEPMLLARDTMLPFLVLSTKSAERENTTAYFPKSCRRR